jgi:AcrR family transcriptional regulator
MTAGVTSGQASVAAPRGGPTRRERQRQATFDEIVEVSRTLMRSSPGELSLRAVAAEMGMTAPALYRYVDSYAELLVLVARAIFTDVVDTMRAACDAYPADDPAAQIVAASTAFRSWALSNPIEFRLVFATPVPEEAQGLPGAPRDPITEVLAPCAPDNGAHMFAAFFSEIFGRLWAKYHFHVPTDDELDPAVLAVLQEQVKPAEVTDGFGAVTPGMIWTFERAWARLYGTVTLEVFGHIYAGFIESGALFTATLLDIGTDLGLAEEWERLRPIAHAGLTG